MAAVDWPLPQAHRPVLDSLRMRAPSLLRRTEFEDGPDRVRRTVHVRPHIFQASFDVSAADLAVLRRWVEEEINGGADWFNLEAAVDGRYLWLEARLVESDGGLYDAQPVDQQTFGVSLGYELRELPRLADADFLAGLLGGGDALTVWAAELDIAVNVELPQAAGAA